MEQVLIEQPKRPAAGVFFSSLHRIILAGQPIKRLEFAARFIGSFVAFIAFLNINPEAWEKHFALIFLTLCAVQLSAMYWRLRDCWELRRTAILWLIASAVFPFLYIWWLLKPSKGDTNVRAEQ